MTAVRLRVAFDATAIPGRRVGAGVYVTELLRAMARLDVDLHVFVNDRDLKELSSIAPAATLHPVRVPSRPVRLLWAQSMLPLRVRRLRPDVFHGPHYTLPSGLRCATVVTFHDPTFFTLPELHERSKVTYFARAARTGISRATRVIAVSEYTRRGGIEHAGADAAVVDVVHHGVDHARYRPAPLAEPARTGAPYILFVGALEPRKDVPTLLWAYEELASSGLPYELVLAGPPAWGAGEISSAVERMRAGTVRRPSFVSEEEKIELYRGASLFVYPSVAEGFGLPVLEAMACGAPVVTTTGSAPEEIAGDAVLLVPPRDRDALHRAMARVLNDDALARDLRRRGPERARTFTWTETAERTLDVYRRAVEQHA